MDKRLLKKWLMQPVALFGWMALGISACQGGFSAQNFNGKNQPLEEAAETVPAEAPEGSTADGIDPDASPASPALPAATPIPPASEPSCRVDAECAETSRCVGKPQDGSSEFGSCRDTTRLEGEGLLCNAKDPCLPGLICAGTSLWKRGVCVPAWMSATYTSTARTEIPRIGEAPAVDAVVVRGLGTVPMDILVKIQLRATPCLTRALHIVLVDPNGMEDVLWKGPLEARKRFPRRFNAVSNPRDDQVNGQWRLLVTNLGNPECPLAQGAIEGWSLSLTSRWD